MLQLNVTFLNEHATQSATYHDHHCKQKYLLYAGQSVCVLSYANTLAPSHCHLQSHT